jgi:hypothetical protein
MKKRLIERILNRIVVGPRLYKAPDKKWTIKSALNQDFLVKFGMLIEVQNEATVRNFIFGKYCISLGTSLFEKPKAPTRKDSITMHWDNMHWNDVSETPPPPPPSDAVE